MEKKEYIKPIANVHVVAAEAQTVGFGHSSDPVEGGLDGNYEDDGELPDASMVDDYYATHGSPNN
jgi:hypothetical protein